ncbi:MAG: polysaccharide biosynthesis protein [Phycisphaeraceae bacterium]|nr:polysaccharide biosynthesis protein [Phycisphaeraceae bacterium]
MSRAKSGTDVVLPSRGQRYLLVGTKPTLEQMRSVLNSVQPGLRIVGELLPDVCKDPVAAPGIVRRHKADCVLISLPMVMQRRIGDLIGVLDRAGVAWRFMPTLADQLAGRTPPLTAHAQAGSLDPAALIEREPRPLDEQAIRKCLEDRVVLITGAGGSIGSEMARIVCRFNPRKLVLVERSENALFEISRQLDRLEPKVQRVAELHDVTQPAATLAMVRRHRPHVVFHAAAHKHVPMMEDHPAQAVENNFLGTRSIADALDAISREDTPAPGSENSKLETRNSKLHSGGGTTSEGRRFVMVSTDKAVNPTSVMGATKRLAELYIQHLNRNSNAIFCMVRFGNVLGSACSVLPIWTDQLHNGGPITVTHPEMTRYFMTIPEAAGLVLQAATFSRGGEVFLLDMGKPVRILDLAQRFLRSHGLEPERDVAIQITGIRPGEKLYEELAYSGEDMLPTPHESIRIWRTTPPDPAVLQQTIHTFAHLRDAPTSVSGGELGHPWRNASREAIVLALRSAVPEMVRAAAG